DSREDGRRDVADVVPRAPRLFDQHQPDDLRVVALREPDERRDVTAALVSADSRFLSSAGLARDHETGDRRFLSGAPLDDADQEVADRPRRRPRKDAPRRRRNADVDATVGMDETPDEPSLHAPHD